MDDEKRFQVFRRVYHYTHPVGADIFVPIGSSRTLDQLINIYGYFPFVGTLAVSEFALTKDLPGNDLVIQRVS